MALEIINDTVTRGEYIEFRFLTYSPSGKTKVFEITTASDEVTGLRTLLGYVEWFPRWRKYSLRTLSGMMFEEKCLGDIIEFITTKTGEHRKALNAKG
jgi:hypothetical protein